MNINQPFLSSCGLPAEGACAEARPCCASALRGPSGDAILRVNGDRVAPTGPATCAALEHAEGNPGPAAGSPSSILWNNKRQTKEKGRYTSKQCG